MHIGMTNVKIKYTTYVTLTTLKTRVETFPETSLSVYHLSKTVASVRHSLVQCIICCLESMENLISVLN